MLIAYRLFMNTLDGQKTLGYYMSQDSAEVEKTHKAIENGGYNLDIEQIEVLS